MSVPSTSIDELLSSDDMWVCDTGASNHCIRSNVGVRNVRKSSVQTQGMTGSATDSSVIVDVKMTHFSNQGVQGTTFTMKDVIYNPNFKYNLFSASKCLLDNWGMTGTREGIELTSPNGEHKIKFDIPVRTKKGIVYAAIFKRDVEITGAELEKVKNGAKITLKQAHEKLGHSDIEKTRRTAKGLSWELKDGTMEPCPSCAAGKARQKNVPKKTEREKSTIPGERIHQDLSTVIGGCTPEMSIFI
jgi:hypothetical protein